MRKMFEDCNRVHDVLETWCMIFNEHNKIKLKGGNNFGWAEYNDISGSRREAEILEKDTSRVQERGHKVVDSGKQTLTLFLLRFLLQHSNPIRNN
ncbi:unnamed protein product [Sphenostylis stenocarpa]|uniref:Uncharacterized protein n=1 Tax=Sphenostylis stenocarpa TaxID=92480 RepID=A0AA86SMY2_9FABA|nr:unnamed protein product [Sphenostylis stenocarpa]